MPVLDAHQHFWQYDPQVHGWITDDMQAIRKDFLPQDILPVLQKNGVDGCIAVQAEESEKETDFLIGLASQNSFIKAVVGWTDLCADNVSERLQYYRQFPIVKGFRTILQARDPAYMLENDFMQGIAALQSFHYTFDILVYPEHLTAVAELISRFPQQKFVIDHLAKPDSKRSLSNEWKKQMISIAKHENVYCKISGMITEADWHSWTKEDLFPYLDVVTRAFGTKRLLYGSDWPVCLVAASYERVIDIVQSYFEKYSQVEKGRIFVQNAIDFYHI